jgi:hypothetical protein
MATRIVFINGQETAVTETESEVVGAIRRDHPNPVKLEGNRVVVVGGGSVGCRPSSSLPAPPSTSH